MNSSTAMLLSGALHAANAVNAHVPVARSGPVSLPSFASGWISTEAPLPLMGIQAAAAAGFASRGALGRPSGKFGLGLTAASWVGLAATQRASMRAEAVLEEALRTALGPEYRSVLTLEDRPLGLAERLIPGVGKRSNLFASDIAYHDGGKRNTLDIWRSPDLPADGRAPVLVQVHGGAWIVGAKEEQGRPLMSWLADHGWVSVAINYRLSPAASWPDHIIDVKRALAWVKAHIAEFGGDPDFVAITGGSAGGHLSSLAALSPNEPVFQPGFENADTSVEAAVPFYGVYDFTNRDGTGREDIVEFLQDRVFKTIRDDDFDTWERASSMSWVRADSPPFFIIHGTNDSLVPVEQGRAFATMMAETSDQPVAYAELPGAQHAFDIFSSVRTAYTIRAVHRFLESVRVRLGHGGESMGTVQLDHA